MVPGDGGSGGRHVLTCRYASDGNEGGIRGCDVGPCRCGVWVMEDWNVDVLNARDWSVRMPRIYIGTMYMSRSTDGLMACLVNSLAMLDAIFSL